MILYLKTDAPLCELTLQKDDDTKIEAPWQADRLLAKELLSHIEGLLKAHQADWQNIIGLVVFRGPGSFTGLRIGATVMNTIAYAQTVPVVGTMGEQWQAEGYQRLHSGGNDRIVTPEYGREARITKPRK